MPPCPAIPCFYEFSRWGYRALSAIPGVLGLTEVEATGPNARLIHRMQVVGNRGVAEIHVQDAAVLTPQLRCQSIAVITPDFRLLRAIACPLGQAFQILLVDLEVVGVGGFHELFANVMHDLITLFGSQVSHGSHESLAVG